jgi:hypothetical protein
MLTRRSVIGGAATSVFAARTARAALPELTFEQVYSAVGVLGMTFSERVRQLDGRRVVMRGFMAPPLKAEARFFVLTKTPLALCPFCSSDADWPSDIAVVYLDEKQTFVQSNTSIEVDGLLSHGSWTDPETGFVSLLRLMRSGFAAA